MTLMSNISKKNGGLDWLFVVTLWVCHYYGRITSTSAAAAAAVDSCNDFHVVHAYWGGRINGIRGGGVDTDWENDDKDSNEEEEVLWKRPFRFHMQVQDEIQTEHQLQEQLNQHDHHIKSTATASLRLIPDNDEDEEDEEDEESEDEYDEEYDEEDEETDDEEMEDGEEGIVRKEVEDPLKQQIQPSDKVLQKSKEEVKDTDSVVTATTSQYMSSGYWSGIDSIVSLGMANWNPQYRLSTKLHKIRKKTAQLTGLHGFLSGKHTSQNQKEDEEKLGQLRQRLSAIQSARERVLQRADIDSKRLRFDTRDRQRKPNTTNYPLWRRVLFLPPSSRQRDTNNQTTTNPMDNDKKDTEDEVEVIQMTEEEKARQSALKELQRVEELQRQKRVKEIDSLILESQNRLLELQCQKDVLQRRPNPFYQYNTTAATDGDITNTNNNSRQFEFPSSSLVKEYIDHLISQKRLIKLNHTELWKQPTQDEENDTNANSNEEQIGDDILTPSADAHKLYTSSSASSSSQHRKKKSKKRKKKHSSSTHQSSKSQSKYPTHSSNGNGNGHTNGNGNSVGGGGSWLLRTNLLGGGVSLGEKIGEVAENAAYEGVCSSVMMVLARSISALHGINVLTHSDVRLSLQQQEDDDDDDLPPNKSPIFSQTDYAQETIRKVIRKSRSKNQSSSVEFLQRDAVVETLLSHCQISAPLLKLFPLAWQRAMLGNIITLIAAVVSDFADGIQLQILGHRMTFQFQPITSEADLLLFQLQQQQRQIQKSKNPFEFEAAIQATAQDISNSLAFLDRWHERALGSGMLRAQIANLIARLVLTLVDEVLHGAKMDLWSNQVPGSPRVLAGLEHRTSSQASTANPVNTKNVSPSIG